jgi:hypothetical protein
VRISIILALGVLVLSGCKACNHDPPELTVTPVPPTSASAELSSDTVEKLEAAFAAAEKAHPNGMPECGPGVKGPCSMKTTSEIGHLKGEAITSQGDALPPALHGSGEALRGAWIAPDGTSFLVGYDYTGVPGPDTGVVYRKDPGPGAAWTIAYSKRENELGHIWGTSAKDVWVAGVKTLAHWDGKAWAEEKIPVLEGSLTGVWGNGKDLYVVGGDWKSKGERGRIFRRDASGAWTVDGRVEGMLYDVGGAGSLVLAVGDDGLIVRRTKAGTWTSEGLPGGQNTRLFVANEHDIWVAGSKLLHSKGDGVWKRETLPTTSQPTQVWGRSGSDVYVGTLGGLFHLRGGEWRATAWDHEVGALSGNASEVIVANQRMGGR